jgi:hypothetical protein
LIDAIVWGGLAASSLLLGSAIASSIRWDGERSA